MKCIGKQKTTHLIVCVIYAHYTIIRLRCERQEYIFWEFHLKSSQGLDV